MLLYIKIKMSDNEFDDDYRKVMCHIPLNVINKVKKNGERINVFKYRTTSGFDIMNTPNKCEFAVLGGKSYTKNTLYKDTTLSKQNNIFDYYKVLKTGINKNNILEYDAKPLKKKKKQPYFLKIKHYPKDDPLIIKF